MAYDLNLSTVLTAIYTHSSTYFLVCLMLAIFSILFTWLYERHWLVKLWSNKDVLSSDAVDAADVDADSEDGWREGAEAGRVDTKTLADLVAAEMTPEQRNEELAVEREQLAAIFKLLREQEDKFQVSSMQQLQEQLSLYR